MMDSPLIIALIGVVGSILAVLISYRFTTRSARKAQAQTADIEKIKVDALAYERARESYDAALETQQARIAVLQKNLADDRAEYRSAIADCKAQIRELDQLRREDRTQIHTLIVYLRMLIGILRQHNIPFPEPPVELDEL